MFDWLSKGLQNAANNVQLMFQLNAYINHLLQMMPYYAMMDLISKARTWDDATYNAFWGVLQTSLIQAQQQAQQGPNTGGTYEDQLYAAVARVGNRDPQYDAAQQALQQQVVLLQMMGAVAQNARLPHMLVDLQNDLLIRFIVEQPQLGIAELQRQLPAWDTATLESFNRILLSMLTSTQQVLQQAMMSGMAGSLQFQQIQHNVLALQQLQNYIQQLAPQNRPAPPSPMQSFLATPPAESVPPTVPEAQPVNQGKQPSLASDDLREKIAESLAGGMSEENTSGLMMMARQLLEQETNQGIIRPERKAELAALIDIMEQSASSKPTELGEMMAEAAKLRQALGRAGNLMQDPSRPTPSPPAGTRAAQLAHCFKNLQAEIVAEAEHAKSGDEDTQTLIDLQKRLMGAKNAIHVLASDSSATALERDSLRQLALEIREYSQRHNLTVAMPYWNTTPVSVNPSAVFYSGGAEVEGLLDTVCTQLGLDRLKNTPARELPQDRWDQLRRAAVCVFDIKRYLNARTAMTDLERATVATVCFEMGIAMTLGKPVVIVARIVDGELQRPFDVDVTPIVLSGDSNQDRQTLAAAIDGVLYGRQRGATDSSIKRTIQRSRELLADHPNYVVKHALDTMSDDVLNDPAKAVLILKQTLDFAGAGSPQIIYPIVPGRYPEPGRKVLFHVMEFRNNYADDARNITEEICKAQNVTYVRGDMEISPNIIRRIWDGIGQATHVLVDMTLFNPNVAFELGIALVLGRKVAVVRRCETDLALYPQFQGISMQSYCNQKNASTRKADPRVPMDDTGKHALREYVREFVLK